MAQPTFNILMRNKVIPKFLHRNVNPGTINRSISVTGIFNNESGATTRRDVAGSRRDFKNRVDKMKFKGIYHKFKRSQFTDWNYDAEMYGFGKRLNETFNDTLLREAFIDPSYVTAEMKRLEEVGIKEKIQFDSNRELAAAGRSLIEDFSKKYFRSVWPLVPEEGIEKISEYMTSVEVLGNIAANLGFKDLIMSEEHTPTEDMYARSFSAIVGALNASSGVERAHKFIIDFVLTQMVGKSIWDVWQLHDTMSILQRLTVQSGLEGPLEPRILGQIGKNTLESVYHIGIYINKEIYETGYGESIDNGIEAAVLNSLSKLFGQSLDSPPIPFKQEITPDSIKSSRNKTLAEWDGKC